MGTGAIGAISIQSNRLKLVLGNWMIAQST